MLDDLKGVVCLLKIFIVAQIMSNLLIISFKIQTLIQWYQSFRRYFFSQPASNERVAGLLRVRVGDELNK